MPRVIAVLGEHRPSYGPHQSTDAAIGNPKELLGVDLGVEWIAAQAIDERRLRHFRRQVLCAR